MVINACGMILEMGEISIMRLRKVFIFGLVCLLFFGVLFLLVGVIPNNNELVCGEDQELLNNASEQIQALNTSELMITGNSIKSRKSYQKDPNCMYILTHQSILSGDSAGARENYEKLVLVYNPGIGYAEDIVEIARKPDELKPMVEFLESQKNNESNFFFGGAKR